MAKTSNEVCTEALRLIGVVADDEPMNADQSARAKAHMDDIFATVNNTEGVAFDWTVETVPDGAFLSFARAIAGSVCTTYNKAEFSGFYNSGIRGLKRFASSELNSVYPITKAEYF